MTDTGNARDGVPDTEAWLIVAADVLDTTHDVLTRLSPAAQAEITTILADVAPGYRDCSNLTERVETARDHLNHK
jgi:hypothetical protein